MNAALNENRTSPAMRWGPPILLIVVIVAEIFLSGSAGVFSRNFWLDEVRTYVTIADPSLEHVFDTLKGGLHTYPPTYFIALRWFSNLLGDQGETSLRLFSFLCTLIAFLGIYVLLKKAFSPLVSFTAVTALWAHPLIFRYAFEARSYTFWLAAIVWFALALASTPTSRHKVAFRILIAITAALASTAQYLGVVTVALVVFSELVFNRHSLRERMPDLAAVLIGSIPVLFCIPYFYFSQRAALPGTVFPALNTAQLLRVGSDLFPVTHLPVLLVACWFSFLWFRARNKAAPECETTAGLAHLAGLSGLLALPLVLLVFALGGNNVMSVPRYALTSCAGLAVLMACLLARTARPLVVCLLVFFFALGSLGLRAFASSAQAKDRRTAELIAAIRALPDNAPVLFEITRDLMVVWRCAPDVEKRCFFLDYDNAEIGGVDAFRTYVRNEARNAAKYYPYPALFKWDEARRLSRIYLVPGYREPGDLAGLERDYRGFEAHSVTNNLVELVAREE